MIGKLILWYLRNSPIEKKKYLIERHLGKLLPARDTKTVYTNPHGITFWIDNRDFVMNKIFTRGLYERNTIRHMIRLIEGQEGHMVDCGANVGLYSLYLSRFAPKARIHSFEPIPRTLEVFRKNIELNKAANIKVNPIGLSNRAGQLDLFIIEEENYGRNSENNTSNSQNKITIEIDTLDNYCAQNNIPALTFIKVDIEGGEMNFIKGAQKIIAASPKLMMIVEINECAYGAGHSPKELYDFIMSMGFDSYVERDYPFGMRKINELGDFEGNVIFLKGYNL